MTLCWNITVTEPVLVTPLSVTVAWQPRLLNIFYYTAASIIMKEKKCLITSMILLVAQGTKDACVFQKNCYSHLRQVMVLAKKTTWLSKKHSLNFLPELNEVYKITYCSTSLMTYIDYSQWFSWRIYLWSFYFGLFTACDMQDYTVSYKCESTSGLHHWCFNFGEYTVELPGAFGPYEKNNNNYTISGTHWNALNGNFQCVPIQSNAFRRAQVVLLARILHTFDHIQIGILPVPIRSALKSNKTSWLYQCLSSLFLKVLTVSASTTSFGKLFHILTTRAQNEYFLML